MAGGGTREVQGAFRFLAAQPVFALFEISLVPASGSGKCRRGGRGLSEAGEAAFPSRWPRPPAARNYSAAFPGQREAKLGFVGDLMGQKENAGEPASTVRNTRQALVGVTVVLMKDSAVQRAWGCLRDLGAHLEVRPILPRGLPVIEGRWTAPAAET